MRQYNPAAFSNQSHQLLFSLGYTRRISWPILKSQSNTCVERKNENFRGRQSVQSRLGPVGIDSSPACEKRPLASSCLYVCPYGTRLPTHGFRETVSIYVVQNYKIIQSYTILSLLEVLVVHLATCFGSYIEPSSGQ